MRDFHCNCTFIGTMTFKQPNFLSTSFSLALSLPFLFMVAVYIPADTHAYSFCLALSFGTHVLLSLLKGSSSIQVCTYVTVKAVIVCATTPRGNCLLIEVIRAVKTIEEQKVANETQDSLYK